MVHHTKLVASVGLAQAHPNYELLCYLPMLLKLQMLLLCHDFAYIYTTALRFGHTYEQNLSQP